MGKRRSWRVGKDFFDRGSTGSSTPIILQASPFFSRSFFFNPCVSSLFFICREFLFTFLQSCQGMGSYADRKHGYLLVDGEFHVASGEGSGVGWLEEISKWGRDMAWVWAMR